MAVYKPPMDFYSMNYEDGGSFDVPMQDLGSAPKNPSAAVIDALKQQILSQGTTDKWTGQGFGSAESNAADMARILAGIGITDVNQFGKLPDGSFGNKVTGQTVPNTYSERQTGNAWGGTFEGKGNTGYRVEFDAQGKPLFFTTGASSSDVPSWVGPALAIGGLAFGLGGLGELFGGAAAGASELGGLSALDAGMGAYGSGTGLLGSTVAAPAASSALAGSLATEGLPLSSLVPEAGLLSSDLIPVSATIPETAAALPSVAPEVSGMGTGAGITQGYSGLGLNPSTAGLGAEGLGAGITSSGLTNAGILSGSALGAGLLGTTATTGLTGTGVLSGSNLGTSLLGTGAGTAPTVGGIGNTMANLGTNALDIGSATSSPFASNALNSLFGNAITSGLGLAGGILQSQTSREAAQAAADKINAATQAAVSGSQFRPVGMTTRFGTSNFTYDPTTGQMVSAGYQLTPEAKAQQDRLVALQNAGLTQAEQAQAQYAPLQTGASNLFNLGNQYIQKSPEAVAQDYINKQLALLAPSRETAMANLANTLSSKGTTGLSIAQGGGLKAANPVAQAFANAQAMQDLQLAAQAQQAGQQNTLFGTSLLGQGANAMNQYYGGQQAAYTPYTTATGQVQGLEAFGQQPFTMSTGLGQQVAQAGANAGNLGLRGTTAAGTLLTSPAVTNNPYASLLGGLASPTSTLGQGIANWITGYDASANQNAALNPYFTPGTWS
jgi:hypothetical protein